MSDNRFDADPLFIAARIASDVRHELNNSQTIKTIMKAAKEQYENALDALVNTDPTNVEAIMKAQNDAKRYLDIDAWITSVIVTGDNAEAQAHEEDLLS